MKSSENKKSSKSDLSKIELDCLSQICKAGGVCYTNHISELDSLVEKGLIYKGKHTNIDKEELYYSTALTDKIRKI